MGIRYRTRQGALWLVSGSEDESCDEVSKDQVVQALQPADQQAGDAAGLVADSKGQGIDNTPTSIPASNDIDEVDLEEQVRARSASRTLLVNTRPERPSEESDIEDEEDMKAQAKTRSASGTLLGNLRSERPSEVRDASTVADLDMRPSWKLRPEKPYDIHNTLSNADSDVRTMVRPTGNGRASLIDRRYIRPHDIHRRCPDEEAAKNCPGEFELKTPGRHAPDEETTGELQDGLPRPGLSHLERSEKVPWGKCEVDLGRTPATQRALVPERKTGMDPGQMPCGEVPRLDSPAFHQFAEEVFQRMTERHRNENIGQPRRHRSLKRAEERYLAEPQADTMDQYLV